MGLRDSGLTPEIAAEACPLYATLMVVEFIFPKIDRAWRAEIQTRSLGLPAAAVTLLCTELHR